MKNTKQKIISYLTILLTAVLCCESIFINVPISLAVEIEEEFTSDATQFRKTLSQSIKTMSEDGEIQEITSSKK